jgi:hypothetical protein
LHERIDRYLWLKSERPIDEETDFETIFFSPSFGVPSDHPWIDDLLLFTSTVRDHSGFTSSYLRVPDVIDYNVVMRAPKEWRDGEWLAKPSSDNGRLHEDRATDRNNPRVRNSRRF